MTKNRTYRLSAGLLLADIIMFNSVNPQKATAIWLIVGYALLALNIWNLVTVFGGWLAAHAVGIGNRPSKRLGRYVAVLFTLLIGLQSVGQLTTKDAVAIMPLMLIVYMYFGYGKRVVPERA